MAVRFRLNPELVLRCAQGQWRAQLGRHETVLADSEWSALCAFAAPQPAPQDDAAMAHFDRWLARLWLLPEEAAPPARPAAALLAQGARSVQALAGLDAVRPLAGDALCRVAGAIDTLTHVFEQGRQLALAEARAQAPALLAAGRLHIGPGERPLPGWINLGPPPAEWRLDVTWGLPLADASLSRVYASHVLEHLYYPAPALAFLKECRRVLGAEGVLRLVVPDIAALLRAYVEGDASYFADRRQHWPDLPAQIRPLYESLHYAGAYSDPASFLDAHKFGYDEATLHELLQLAGFRRIRRCAYQQSPWPDLKLDDHSLIAAAHSRDRPYSLFMEAQP